MAIQLKNDVSYLFSSLNSSKNTTGMGSLYSLLGDYNNIKAGSYGKLMKAYYAVDASDEVSSLAKKDAGKNTIDKEAKAVATAQTKVNSLNAAVDKLYTSEEDSVWAKGDMDEIYKAVSEYVTSYNASVESVAAVDDKTVKNRGVNLVNNTAMYKDDLEKIGITVNKDDSLSINKDTFMAAGAEKVQEVFNGRGSYGHVQNSQAELLKSSVDYEAVSASTYNSRATYNTLGAAGNLFNSLF